MVQALHVLSKKIIYLSDNRWVSWCCPQFNPGTGKVCTDKYVLIYSNIIWVAGYQLHHNDASTSTHRSELPVGNLSRISTLCAQTENASCGAAVCTITHWHVYMACECTMPIKGMRITGQN